MAHALCMLAETTNTHSGYVILNAFRRQQWLCERTTILRYAYIASLVCFDKSFSLRNVIYISTKFYNFAVQTFLVLEKFVYICNKTVTSSIRLTLCTYDNGAWGGVVVKALRY